MCEVEGKCSNSKFERRRAATGGYQPLVTKLDADVWAYGFVPGPPTFGVRGKCEWRTSCSEGVSRHFVIQLTNLGQT